MSEATKTVTRRELRRRLGSRVVRRANTKAPRIDAGTKKHVFAERPRIRLQQLIRKYQAEGYTVV
jgi:hypothetical protein